ncbi:hypothetical protein BDN72DRAFT_847599 [Pluteus cervinus]|uniref:Uncharacterized protein n=1 Tax=Pluteus cervinus TaxID=181527 RepID=A0ACD3ACY9_9AGAR|nr:hypothetical protein BDN72DRAFT_847599 [Pluteus cervinus]
MPLTTPHHVLNLHFDNSNVAFQKIDEELAVLRESIRALQAFRNTFTPIYRLPPEILSRIFSFTQPGVKNHNRSTSLRWTRVTYVSQHWRNVAISTPSLWTHIDRFRPKDLVEMWLQRSKAAPLFVNLCPNSSEDEYAYLIKTSLFRIRELRMEVGAGTWNSFWSNLSSPAPLLACLEVSIPRTLPPLTISDSTFAGATPCLRRLELTGCSVDLNSHLFKDLTVLELHSPPQKILARDLLITIRKLPGLASLVLSDVLHKNAAPLSSNFDTITLPHLGKLSIKGGSFVEDLDFLSHLSFPTNTTLQLYSETQASTEGMAAALLNFMSVYNAARCQQSFPYLLNLSLDDWNTLELTIRAECTERAHNPALPVFVDLRIYGWLRASLQLSDTPETTALLSSLPLPFLASFSTSCNLDAKVWANGFGHLPNLKHISVARAPALNFLSAMVDDPTIAISAPLETKNMQAMRKGAKRSTGGGVQLSTPQVPIFPELETIELRRVVLPRNTTNLVNVLLARKSVGKGIKFFELRECLTVDGWTQDALLGCVDRVIWDRCISSYDGDEDNSD